MSFFERLNCGVGQGLFLYRTMRGVAQRDGISQEDLQILYRIVHLLYCNEYLDMKSQDFYVLAEKGFQYLQGANDLSFESHLELVVDYDNDSTIFFQQLWWLVGKEEKAPFYVTEPKFYNTICHYLTTEPSYSSFIQKRTEQGLSTSRVSWFGELAKKLPKEDRERFLKDLSQRIDEEYNIGVVVGNAEPQSSNNPFESVDNIENAYKKQVFISYVHEDEEHTNWVRKLASDLQKEFNVIIDLEMPLGEDIIKFMEKSVRDSDKVLLILTPEYKRKADNREFGAGYETKLITTEIYKNDDTIKFIPIVRKGTFKTSYPIYLGMRNGLDMTKDESYEHNLEILKRNLRLD